MVRDDNNIPAAIAGLQLATDRAVEEVAQEMVSKIDEGFDSGQDALGRPWAPLQPETIAQTGPDILIDEGDLRESIEYEMVGTAHARVKSEDSKAVYHEFGVPENNLPARPIFAPAAEYANRDLIETSFDTVVNRALRRVL